MYKELVQVLSPYLKKYKYRALGALLLSFVLAGLSGWQLKLIKPLLDTGLSPKSSFKDVLFLAEMLFLLGVLNFPARYYHFYWLRFIGERMNADLREKVFQKLQRLPTSFYNQNKQGKMLSSILNDAEVFAGAYRAIVDVVREPLKALVYLATAFYCDWQLAIVIIIVAPLFVLIFQKSGKLIKGNQGNVQGERAELTHTLSEGLSSHKVTKAFNLQNFVMDRFNRNQEKYFFYQMKTTRVEELAHPLVELIGALSFSLVVVFAYFRVRDSGLTMGAFIQFVGALALLQDPIRKFSQANVKVGQGIAAYHRLKVIFDYEEEIDKGQLEITKFNSDIIVKDVTFSYGTHPVIQNLNLQIKKGQKVALVGLSGSGKSTLINLLLGLYPLKHGSISIDGNNIKDIKLKNLRGLFGLVSQDIFLFHDTIKENLMIGGKFTDEEIKRSLEVSYAHEFVDKLPEGMNTIIGDRGAKLSGGQQQRITIARAFLQNTEILLFDEATSALDNESEKVVQKALDTIAGNKTVIAVAHRLSTIQEYDQIFVMKEGRLIEQGTHQELMNLSGEYRKLYELSQKM
jgi:subfamily B ATP-binding cassette protein MsbA